MACSSKVLLRAGYLGHVTRIGQVLQEAAAQQQEIADVLQATPSWPELLQQLAGPEQTRLHMQHTLLAPAA